MDTRNYDEPSNCGLKDCDCSEVDKCGCTFPNNISNYSCACTDLNDCGCFSEEKTNDQGEQKINDFYNTSSNIEKNASSRNPGAQSCDDAFAEHHCRETSGSVHISEESVCFCGKDSCDCSQQSSVSQS